MLEMWTWAENHPAAFTWIVIILLICITSIIDSITGIFRNDVHASDDDCDHCDCDHNE